MTYLIIILCSSIVFGQENNEISSLIPETVIETANCESNLAKMTVLVQTLPFDSLIIIISHLGEGEDEKFGHRRLYNAKTLFTKLGSNARQEKYVVTAKGNNSDERGYIDFYVGGKLKLRIYFSKNDDLYLSGCILMPEEKRCSTKNEKLFYPCHKSIQEQIKFNAGTYYDDHMFLEYPQFTVSDIESINYFSKLLRKSIKSKGYIIVYAGKESRKDEAEFWIKKFRKHLIENLKIKEENLSFINGGFREIASAKLFILPCEIDPPRPTPSVPPDQVKIITKSNE